jgi:hypothetical protein
LVDVEACDRQPLSWAMKIAGPPDPLATSRTSDRASIPSSAKKLRYSSAVSQENCPISSPNVSRRMVAYSSSAASSYVRS